MLENLPGPAAPVGQGPVQIPIETPIALVLIAGALLFLPEVLGVGGGNLGGSNQTLLGTIEHDFQHLVTDIVGIIQHHQLGHL
jgi:hypothetical protein